METECVKCKGTKKIVVSQSVLGQTTIPCECTRGTCWECGERKPAAEGKTVCVECWNKAHPDLPI